MSTFALGTSAGKVQAFAGALWGVTIGSNTMALVNSDINNLGLSATLNTYYTAAWGSNTAAQTAATMVANLGITDGADGAKAYVEGQLMAVDKAVWGQTISNMLTLFNGLVGDATYGAAATAWVALQETAVAYTGATDVAVGAVVNDFVLTTGIDSLDLSNRTGADVVTALLDGTDSTLTVLDSIEGNGMTVLKIVDVDYAGGAAEALPFVDFSGIGSIEFVNAGDTGTVSIDGGHLGEDVSSVSVAGTGGINVDIDDLVMAGDAVSFDLGVADNELHLSGEWGGWAVSLTMTNSGEAGNSLELSTGDVGLAATVGKSASLSLTLSVTDTTSGAASVGDISFGDISVSAAKNADYSIEFTISASSTSSGDASVGNVSFGDVSLTNAVGDGSGTLEVSVSAYADSGEASIGDVTFGNVTLVNHGTASLSATYSMSADANDGSATVGNVTVGNVSLANDADGFAWFELNAFAYADDGDATVGNISVGNTVMSLGKDGNASFSFSASASVSGSGNATVGDISVGSITGVAAASMDDMDGWVYAWAYADSGSATIGNVTVGDISFTVGKNTDWASYSMSLSATSDVSGDATIGDVSVGNMTMTGATNADLWFGQYLVVSAGSGTATIGNYEVGDISVSSGKQSRAYFSISLEADATSGDAVIGDVTIGNIGFSVGKTADQISEVNIVVNADASSGDAIIGNVSIGDFDLALHYKTSLSLEVSITATGDDTSSVGDISIGSVMVDGATAASGSLTVDYDISSSGSIGAVTLGAVDADLHLFTGTALTYSVSVSADGNLTSFTAGTVALTAEDVDYYLYVYGDDIGSVVVNDISLSGDTVDFSMSITASGDMGNVTIGNITVAADVLNWQGGILVSATDGDLGNVTIGDISIDSTDTDSLSIDIFASRELGNVTIGNIDTSYNVYIHASASRTMGDFTMGNFTVGSVLADGDGLDPSVHLHGVSGQDMGDVELGDITVTATGAKNVAASISFTADIGTSADSVGTVTFGNITLSSKTGNTAAALDATADFVNSNASLYAGNSGAVTVGNIDITLTNSLNAVNATNTLALDVAAATLDISADDATLTVGNITVSAVNNTASTIDIEDSANDSMFNAAITLTADGALVVGDITVSGGSSDTTSNVLDNLENLFGWLSLTGTTKTVGNIDYSGYDAEATINLTGIKGASNITVGDGGSTITVNATQNTVTLGDGDDTVVWGVTESRTTASNLTVQGYLDVVVNFEAGADTLDLSAITGNTETDGGTLATYAQFLTAAAAANADVFFAVVGSNTYVAVDFNGDDAVNFVIQLTGVTDLAGTDITT